MNLFTKAQNARNTSILVLAALVWCWPARAAAQNQFQAGVQLAGAMSSEFDRSDFGVGGRFTWQPYRTIGAEAELDFYPRDFPNRVAFSSSRLEGLFGATVGPVLGRVRPFGRLRPGFVAFREAPRPIACILIFPPPLACTLASGRTLFALDVGGGVELFASQNAAIRVDIGDRMLKYPGPAFDNDRRVHDDGFFSHDFRFAVGVGWIF
jgi:hypothetical protein